ncbi:glycosyl hydrolase 115 family protein [uncultured Draconibacterium sp.]|uniref:glycosyl hydrolase 115 family protein n=1 Tax=uncultured Draconibacterium sp. TaxID=1573823 RepID=UPI0029C0A9E6|nr:glycosyl hydrolase 115 family protein [uncultured Draconibacterium sp.]
MKPTQNIILIASFLLVLFGFNSCKTNDGVFIIVGEDASVTEKLTAEQLKTDLQKVTSKNIQVISEAEDYSEAKKIILLGTSSSNSLITDLIQSKSIIVSEDFPGKRGGIWAKATFTNKGKAIVFAGSDVQGTQYAVYEYCKEILDVDPFEYWSGKTPNPTHDVFDIPNKVIAPPEIPILCYFENDVDELANIKKPMLEYDWENYTQLINSLVRIKYNAIQLFDMLGRPEFFLRPEYQAIRPDYDIRLSYIDSMITYAQDMGMQAQIDMALGYKIKPMEQDKADCWAKNKQVWIDTWRYYFEETPIGKADIFALRPRNQVWDWEYKSSCGEDKVDVFNEVYAELGDIVDEYKPEATKVLLCYHDGMEMFNNGFNPPKDWIIAWSDDGWVDFDYLPLDTKGYNFGTYMHAGFWLNHTVHDPCPVKIDTIMKMMVKDYGANKYCMVNGQQFRPFLLNLEAFSKMADAPNAFNGEEFYKDWVSYYLGEKTGKFAIASMTKLHEAQFDGVGYVQHLWEIREAISYLSNAPIERPGKTPVPHEYRRVENDYKHVVKRVEFLKESLNEAKKGYEIAGENDIFYHDYILLPVQIYSDLLVFEGELHQMAKLKKQFEDTGNEALRQKAIAQIEHARSALKMVYQRRLTGDKNPTWKGWYHPANRRPNNGFPTQEMLNRVEKNLKTLSPS